ncbi:MAG: PAS domain S-box protein [Verrucomicrobia bacterium]|nr:PAS domain S-box protein [Verrucomicrobiota bacterium]
MKTGWAFKSCTDQAALSFRAACVAIALVLFPHHTFAQAKPDLLTPDERAWLVAHGPLRYAPQVAAPPFGFVKPDGQVAGMTVDLLAVLARHLGAEIKPVIQSPWPAAMAALGRGKIDFLPTVVRTEEREQVFQFIGPYHEAPNVLFVNRATPQFKTLKDLAGRRVGVTRESSIHLWLRGKHPGLALLPVESAREGLLLLALGQVDAVAASLPVGSYFIAETSLNNLRVLPEVLFVSHHHLAVNKGNDRLASILQKGLDSLTTPERQEVLARWTGPEPAPSPWQLPVWIWQAALVLMGGLVGVIAWNQSLRRHVAQQERLIREKVKEEADLERRCTELIENATDMVFTRDFEGHYTSINPAGERILGYSREELLKMNISQVVVPEHMDRVRQQAATLATQESSTYEMQVRAKDGRRIWLEASLRALRKDGRPAGLQGIARDITERKRAEETLRESEERYQMLADHSDDFVSLHDSNSNRLYVSPSYYRVTGWTPEEIFSTDWRTRMHPEDLAKVERAWAANMRGEANTIEHRIRCKDGSWIWVESRRKPILGPDRKVRQIVLWARDVTERKQAEEARAQLEAQLRQAQKMEAVGQLAGGVAHDFNNILTVILGNAHLLEGDSSLPSKARDKIRQLIKSGDRAATLTRQLLAFSRRQVMQMRRLDLNDALSNVTQMLGHLIGEHILLQCNYGPALPRIEADAGMMEQIIVNLAVNARDAMPAGGRLIISTQLETVSPGQAQKNPEARAGQFVTLTVTDTGCGMDEATRSHLFEPFFTTKEVGKGTGLGLAMTYGIIKQHNGWIEAASQVNQGTTFKIFLPACAAGEPPASTSQTSSGLDSCRGSETLLVVEDEEPVRHFLQACLERQGYRILTAASGADALRAWESAAGKVDLLLTDIVMPGGMSGRELAEKLCATQPGLKVILSSGYSREISAELGDFPAWICLPKPYDPVTLAQTVRRCLDAR